MAAFLLLVAAAAPAAARGEPVTLHASDGVTVYGTLTRADRPGRAIALLFHQAGANRHEYDPIVPELTALGFDTLAIDQRAGGTLFGGRNQTVDQRGRNGGYLAALPDLEAALAWAGTRHYPRVVAVGSSYSASLVLLLAARHPPALTAVASFSPGEYFADKHLVGRAAARVTVPLYITTDPAEEARVDAVLAGTHGRHVIRYRPRAGVHGASTLVAARDPDGHAANLASFLQFMRRFAPSGR